MSGKLSLRDYQEALSRKLQEARGTRADTKLAMAVGEERWLLNLTDAAEVLPVPELTCVPGTRSWFRGLAKVRGNLYGVVDLCAFLGGPLTPLFSASRIVLANEKFGINTSLLIGQTLGLKKIEQLTRCDANGPPSPWVLADYRSGAGELWKELDFGELLRSAQFLQVGLKG